MGYDKIRNFRAVNVKMLGATNTRGARIKIWTEDRGEDICSKTFAFDYAYNSIGEQAYITLVANGWCVISKTSLYRTDVFMCDNWGEDYLLISDLKDIRF